MAMDDSIVIKKCGTGPHGVIYYRYPNFSAFIGGNINPAAYTTAFYPA
jgi:hypothetical protein